MTRGNSAGVVKTMKRWPSVAVAGGQDAASDFVLLLTGCPGSDELNRSRLLSEQHCSDYGVPTSISVGAPYILQFINPPLADPPEAPRQERADRL